MEEKRVQLVPVEKDFFVVTFNDEDAQEEYYRILFLGLTNIGLIEYLGFCENLGLDNLADYSNFKRFHCGPPPKGALVF